MNRALSLIDRHPPLRWTAGIFRRLGFSSRSIVVAVPTLWLLVFFLIPFLVVAKISFSEALIAMPPYAPISSWDDEGTLVLKFNFGNYLYLWEDKPLLERVFIEHKNSLGLNLVRLAHRLSHRLLHSKSARDRAQYPAHAGDIAFLDFVPAASLCLDRLYEK